MFCVLLHVEGGVLGQGPEAIGGVEQVRVGEGGEDDAQLVTLRGQQL